METINLCLSVNPSRSGRRYSHPHSSLPVLRGKPQSLQGDPSTLSAILWTLPLSRSVAQTPDPNTGGETVDDVLGLERETEKPDDTTPVGPSGTAGPHPTSFRSEGEEMVGRDPDPSPRRENHRDK